MVAAAVTTVSDRAPRTRDFFADRSIVFHDGRTLRRINVTARAQALLTGAAAVTLIFSAYGVVSAASGIAGDVGSPDAKLERMHAQVEKMQADVAAMKVATRTQAARIEQRQVAMAAMLTGKGDPEQLAATIPDAVPANSQLAALVGAPLQRVEARQAAMAHRATLATQQRIAMTASHLRRLGVTPMGGIGGPFEAADSVEAKADQAADAQFKVLFQTWKKLDTLEQTVIAIPSTQPVANLSFTSNYGVRSDPFRGVAAMHAGVDIPGPTGTPIYATADGVVARAERASGYGNLVEINHGKGIETRYGHLSKILVAPNTRVHRGQLIALMGSTGRSTGSHLHYEVRIDGRAVNPIPFLNTASTMVAIQDRSLPSAVGGPAAVNR